MCTFLIQCRGTLFRFLSYHWSANVSCAATLQDKYARRHLNSAATAEPLPDCTSDGTQESQHGDVVENDCADARCEVAILSIKSTASLAIMTCMPSPSSRVQHCQLDLDLSSRNHENGAVAMSRASI
jgi:hypothetical protein